MLLHQVCSHEGHRPRNASEAVHEHVSDREIVLDEFDCFVEVALHFIVIAILALDEHMDQVLGDVDICALGCG